MIDYRIVKKLNDGGSSVDKYLIEKDNKIYLLRLFDIRFMNSRVKAFNNISKLYDNGVSVPRVVEYGKYNDKQCFAIIEWIEGISLDKLLNSDNTLLYGKIAAQELLKLHKVFTQDTIDIKEKFLKSFYKKIDKLKELGLNYKSTFIEEFVLRNLNVLNGLDTSIIHGDFHPGNIVVNNDKLYFIDLDVCKNDYAWIDLCTNACNLDKPEFYKVVIDEYFNNNVPEKFWLIYNLYGTLYCLDYILYCSRMENKKIEEGIEVLDKFLEYSNRYSILEPKWFRKEISMEEKENERINKIRRK